jgi:hypothetical protein
LKYFILVLIVLTSPSTSTLGDFKGNPMKQLVLTFILGLSSLPVLAGTVAPPNTIPEPGALSLLAIGAVGGLVIWARNRNKK